MRRGFWFAAGAGAGIYVMVRARRAMDAFTPDGLRDRVAGLGVGAHLFAEEVRTGMAERETELRERLGIALDGPRELGSRLGSITGDAGSITGDAGSITGDAGSITEDSGSLTEDLEGTH